MHHMRILPLLILLLLIACSAPSGHSQGGDRVEPVEIGSGEWTELGETLMLPLQLPGASSATIVEDVISRGAYASPLVFNLAFLHVHDGTVRLLTDDLVLIEGHVQAPLLDTTSVMLYRIGFDEVDPNAARDDSEAHALFRSAPDGTDFTRISPEGMHLASFQMLDGTDLVLADLQADDDEDGLFDRSDRRRPYLADLSTGEPLRPVFNEDQDATIDAQSAHWTDRL